MIRYYSSVYVVLTDTKHLGNDNHVYCDNYQTQLVVTMGLWLSTALSIWSVISNVFHTMPVYVHMLQLNKFVWFPQQFEIGPYMSWANCSTPPPYELIGVHIVSSTNT